MPLHGHGPLYRTDSHSVLRPRAKRTVAPPRTGGAAALLVLAALLALCAGLVEARSRVFPNLQRVDAESVLACLFKAGDYNHDAKLSSSELRALLIQETTPTERSLAGIDYARIMRQCDRNRDTKLTLLEMTKIPPDSQVASEKEDPRTQVCLSDEQLEGLERYVCNRVNPAAQGMLDEFADAIDTSLDVVRARTWSDMLYQTKERGYVLLRNRVGVRVQRPPSTSDLTENYDAALLFLGVIIICICLWACCFCKMGVAAIPAGFEIILAAAA